MEEIVSFADSFDFDVLKNESEILVVEELGRQLDAYEKPICRCDTCVVDMAAITLNAVKPLYRVSLLGTQYAAQAMHDPDFAKSVRDSVAKAIERVRKNPAHD